MLTKELEKFKGMYGHLFEFMNCIIVYGKEWLMKDE